MNAYETLDILTQNANGLLRTADAVSANISRTTFAQYVHLRGMERIGNGIYLSPDAWKDGMRLLQLRCPQVIFSHETALFLHGLTDREPLSYTVTVKTGYNPHRLHEEGVTVYTVKKELYDLGLSQTETPFGNAVVVYDPERTICDVLRSRNRMEAQTVRDALRDYTARRDKDLRRLMHYAQALHVETILRSYLAMLL